MRLKSLELLGFKSFLDSTAIGFAPGMTAVVGPNGCGKSNVVDAIRWVLGEQAPTRLRGKSIEDLIYAGNESNPAAGNGRGFSRAGGRRRQPAARAVRGAQRNRGDAPRVSLRRVGISAQQNSVPLEGHHRVLHGGADSQPRLLAGRAGPNRGNYPGQAARAAHAGRGSSRLVAVQGPARDERAQARAGERKSRPRGRRGQRNRASAQLRTPPGQKSRDLQGGQGRTRRTGTLRRGAPSDRRARRAGDTDRPRRGAEGPAGERAGRGERDPRAS